MKFGLAATTALSAGSAAIVVTADDSTRRRKHVNDEEVIEGKLNAQEESKTTSFADIDARFNKFVGNNQVRAGSRKKADLGASDLGVLHQGHGRHMRHEASAMSMHSEIANTEGGRPGKPWSATRPEPEIGNDVDQYDGELSVGSKVLMGLGKVGLDVEGACQDLYAPPQICGEVIGGESCSGSYTACRFNANGLAECNGISTDCYCYDLKCCNKGGDSCEQSCDCCDHAGSFCSNGVCTYPGTYGYV